MLVAFVFNKPFGANNEGDVIQLDPDEAKALVEAGILSEATQEHVSGGNDAEQPVEENAAFTRSIENSIVKATEIAVAKLTAKNEKGFRVPAEVKGPVYQKGLAEMMVDLYQVHCNKSVSSNSKQVQARNRLMAYSDEMGTKAILGANETTNSQGGYDVKPEWFDRIFEKVHDYPKLLERTERIPAQSRDFNIVGINETGAADGQRHGGVLGYYVSEGSTATSSYPALTTVPMALKTLVVLQYVSLQLLQDGNIEAIDKVMGRQAGLEMLWQQNQAVVAGNGSTEPKGILNQASLVTVTKSSDTGSAEIGFDDLANMYRSLYPGSRQNSVFLVNPEVHGALLTMLFPNNASTSVYPAWSLSYNAHEEFPLRIFGRPVIECFNCSQLGVVGDIILCDLSQLTCYERAGIQVDMSDQLQFPTLQIAYRWVYRFDINSPWTAAYTSVDGAYSFSPFVVLQSRGT